MAAHRSDFQDLVARTEGVQPWRRVFHAGSGVALGLLPGALELPRALTLGLLAGAFAIALGLDVARLHAPAVNRTFFRAFSRLASPREAAGYASSTWFVLAAFLSHAVFPPAHAAAALVVLGLADPAASVVGRLRGSVRLGKGSVQGTATFFAVAWAVLAVMTGRPVLSVPVALGVAVLEIVPGLLDDNLVVPLATGGLLWLLMGTPTAPWSLPF